MDALPSYEMALNSLGIETTWSCSFGNPGEGGYVEYRGDVHGNRYTVSNGPWTELPPFTWTATKMEAKP